MRHCLLVLSLLAIAGTSHAQSVDCAAVPKAMPLQQGLLTPIASELSAVGASVLDARGVLGQAYDDSQSVDMVVLRMRIQTCTMMAKAVPAPSAVSPSDPAAYKPRTQYDNAPWRFDMTQNGKSMTAEEFNAWMKARGVRVVPPRPAAPATQTPTQAAPGTKPE